MTQHKPAPLTPDEAQRLSERYFEGETTPAEEALLKRFLASDDGASPIFDELRATLSFFATGKAIEKNETHKNRKLAVPLPRRATRIAAAAIVAIITTSGGFWLRQEAMENKCVAYINGQKTTDTELVMDAMRNCVNDITLADDDLAFEQQLGDIFTE